MEATAEALRMYNSLRAEHKNKKGFLADTHNLLKCGRKRAQQETPPS